MKALSDPIWQGFYFCNEIVIVNRGQDLEDAQELFK